MYMLTCLFPLLLSALLISHVASFVIRPEVFSAQQSLQPFEEEAWDDDTPLPLVIWHGLGDRYDAEGLQEVAELAASVNPGTYVHIISLASDGASDRTASYFGNLTEQIELVCSQLASDKILATAPAINALGFSQGGQFMRAYVERCNNPPVHNLITFGSQHNGIAKFEQCTSPTDFVCHGANALLRSGTWASLVQSRLVPAQYFRDPEDLDNYLKYSNFLADVNNERVLKNVTYRERLRTLNKFVMYMFTNDTVAVPKESGWFAEVNGTTGNVTLLRDRQIYQEDWIGLKELDERGGLVFDTLDGPHMSLGVKDLKSIFRTYLGPAS